MTKYRRGGRLTTDARHPAPARKMSGWWLGGAAIALLLLGLCALLFLRSDRDTGKPLTEGSQATPASEAVQTGVSPAGWQGPLPAELARLFTTAKTHAERLELIADPSKDGYWMERFFREGAGAREKVSEVTPMGPVGTDKVSFERFRVIMEDGGSRLLCVIISDRGCKVDFRSYARFGLESWEDLLSGATGIAKEVRVFIEPGTAYLHNYSDDLQWSSYIATSPDTEQPLYFYAPRDSATDKQLAQVTAGATMRATLAIRSIGDAHKHRQFEVTEVITAGWVK